MNINRVGCARTNNAIINECYNEQFFSIKPGCCNEKRSYNERGGILFIMESSIIVFTRERSFMFFMCAILFTLYMRESLFVGKFVYIFQIKIHSI